MLLGCVRSRNVRTSRDPITICHERDKKLLGYFHVRSSTTCIGYLLVLEHRRNSVAITRDASTRRFKQARRSARSFITRRSH